MTEFDQELRRRLATLEQSVVVPSTVPRPARRRMRRAWVIGVAALFFVGSAASATAVTRHVLHAHSAVGLFSPSGTLACSNVWEMTPSQAQSYLEDRGYTVYWQVETDASTPTPLTRTPPSSGYIIEGVADGNELTLVVEQGPDAVAANLPHC